MLSLLLVACAGGPSAKNGIAKGQQQKGGFMGLSKNDAVEVTSPKAFSGTEQVVIGAFTVGFATYKTDSAKAGGGLMGNGFGGKSTAKSTLAGIDKATMQKITDAAYEGFIKDLKAKGYSVADHSTIANYPKFRSTKSYPSPYEDSSGGLFGAKSKTVYFAPSSFGENKFFLNDIPGTMGGFAFGNPSMAAMQYAKDTSVKVLNVVYVLDFANSESYGGWAKSSSAVEVGQGLTVVPTYSKIGLTGGDAGTFSNANGNLVIGQPITSEKEFASISDATSDASRVSQTAANVLGVIGGIGTNATREYTFQARPADYTIAAKDALSQANAKLIGTMSSLK